MVTSTDTWFRPSDVCVAPDGSVLITDWYDPGVGGHGMGDITRGRIYRLTPKGHVGYQVPDFKLDKNDVLDALHSPNISVRTVALAKLAADPKLGVVPLIWQDDNHGAGPKNRVHPREMAREMWHLGRIPGFKLY